MRPVAIVLPAVVGLALACAVWGQTMPPSDIVSTSSYGTCNSNQQVSALHEENGRGYHVVLCWSDPDAAMPVPIRRLRRGFTCGAVSLLCRHVARPGARRSAACATMGSAMPVSSCTDWPRLRGRPHGKGRLPLWIHCGSCFFCLRPCHCGLLCLRCTMGACAWVSADVAGSEPLHPFSPSL
jgi:hypothetical protein